MTRDAKCATSFIHAYSGPNDGSFGRYLLSGADEDKLPFPLEATGQMKMCMV
jgi:hypothetical protein